MKQFVKFDYKKAVEEAEKMLEVIERDPQSYNANWINTLQGLVPIFYTLAIGTTALGITCNSLKQVGIIHSQQNKLEGHADVKAFSKNLPLFMPSAGV